MSSNAPKAKGQQANGGEKKPLKILMLHGK